MDTDTDSLLSTWYLIDNTSIRGTHSNRGSGNDSNHKKNANIKHQKKNIRWSSRKSLLFLSNFNTHWNVLTIFCFKKNLNIECHENLSRDSRVVQWTQMDRHDEASLFTKAKSPTWETQGGTSGKYSNIYIKQKWFQCYVCCRWTHYDCTDMMFTSKNLILEYDCHDIRTI